MLGTALSYAVGVYLVHWHKNQGGWGGGSAPRFSGCYSKDIAHINFVNKVHFNQFMCSQNAPELI